MTFTKTAIALTAVLGSATAAAAETSYFSLGNTKDASTVMELDLVRSAADGQVVIREYIGGETGEVLGTAPVYAGANNDVRVFLDTRPVGDVIAILQSGDEVLATKEIDINS